MCICWNKLRKWNVLSLISTQPPDKIFPQSMRCCITSNKREYFVWWHYHSEVNQRLWDLYDMWSGPRKGWEHSWDSTAFWRTWQQSTSMSTQFLLSLVWCKVFLFVWFVSLWVILEMEEGFLFHFRTVRFLSQSLLVLLFYDLILLEKPWFLIE